MSDIYQAILLEELKSPQNTGKLADSDITFSSTNSSCGDNMTVFLKLNADQTVQDIGWIGNGCAISQATMSLLSVELKGKSTEEILQVKQSNLENLIGVEKISHGRVKCLMLGLHAVQQAIKTLQSRP